MKENMNDFINSLLIAQNQSTKIYLFGAGKVGQLVFNLCRQNRINVQGFCVTDTRTNKTAYNGLPVLDVHDLAVKDKSSLLVICVIERGEKRIEKMCRDLGFENLVSIPNDILLRDEWNQRRYKSPIVEVTSKIGCAVDCKFCPQRTLLQAYFKDDKKRKSRMTFVDFKNYLSALPADVILDFSGFVEPFLNEESLAMMEYAAQTGHDITLFTTFLGLNVSDFDRLAKIPFKFVCVHTADADGFAKIPITDSYLKILRMAIETKKPDGSPFIDTANCQSLPHPEVLKISEGKLKIYCEMQDRAGNLDSAAQNLVHVTKNGTIRCSRAAAMNHFVLLPDGSLALCCNDFGLKHIVGNLNYSSYEEIMRGVVMKDVWKAMTDESTDIICRKCFFAEENL